MDWLSDSSGESECCFNTVDLMVVNKRPLVPKKRPSEPTLGRKTCVSLVDIALFETEEVVSAPGSSDFVVRAMDRVVSQVQIDPRLSTFSSHDMAVLAEVSTFCSPSLKVPDVVKSEQVSCGKDVEKIAISMRRLEKFLQEDNVGLKIRVGHVGAVTATEDMLANSSVWTGEMACPYLPGYGKGDVIHGISAKIDGVPMLPVEIEYKEVTVTLVWVLMGSQYVLRETSVPLGHFAEERDGIIYVRSSSAGSVKVGSREYQLRSSPVVLPGQVELLDDLILSSDGYILHSGTLEYKVRDIRTVDLEVVSGKAYTHEGRYLFDAGVSDGIYEFDVTSRKEVRARPDKASANSYAVYERVMSSPSASVLRSRLRHVVSAFRTTTLDRLFFISGIGFRLEMLRSASSRECRVVWDVGELLWKSCATRVFGRIYRCGELRSRCSGGA